MKFIRMNFREILVDEYHRVKDVFFSFFGAETLSFLFYIFCKYARVTRNRTSKYLRYLSLRRKGSLDKVSLFEEVYTAMGNKFYQGHFFKSI